MVAKLATAATPKVLYRRDPIIAPRPIGESVMNVLIKLVKSSGIVPDTAMNVAAATSCKEMLIKFSNENQKLCKRGLIIKA